MRRFISFISFLFLTSSAIAQGISNLWLMGYDSGGNPPFGGVNMDFNGGPLNITYVKRKMNFDITNGVICNKDGNLLFSSNGIYIANAQNDTMVNGNNLNPSLFTSMNLQYGLTLPQANLIIPFPGDSMKYYLFHNTVDDYGNTYCSFFLYYSVIDMAQDSGRGGVINKNTVLLNDSFVFGKLTACKHANGRDWWLISHQYGSDKYYKFLITPSGIQSPLTQHVGTWRGDTPGQVVFSPDGNRFAYFDVSTDLDVFDFDRCTGDLAFKSHATINDSAAGVGAAFSPNSQVLYLSSTNYVYQFDMNAADITASKTTVAVWDSFYSPNPPLAANFYLSQLAPDGKIYISCGNGTLDIHVINQPDSLGLACNFCQHCIHLPAYDASTLPNHPNYFLSYLKSSSCDTLSHIDVQEITGKNQLNVFPNPVSNESDVTFTYSSSSEAKVIEIYNIDGKIVANYNLPLWSSVQHLKLPILSSGIYLAKLSSGKQTSNIKFVVE